MKILALADIHEAVKSAEVAAAEAQKLKADLITISGDITNFGGWEKAREILLALRKCNLPVIYVPGNCDLPEVFEMSVEGCFDLHGRIYSFGGYSFIGVGGSNPTPLGTPSEFEEKEILKILEEAMDSAENTGKLILLSHTPPFRTKLDRLSYTMSSHVGSHAVRSFIEKRKPILAICGHIHDACGVDKLGGSILVNPGSAKYGNFAFITLDGEVEVNLGGFNRGTARAEL
ncbi:MAG: metallophosphoesterase [Candidatus Bathyarchaeia archaeon]